MKFSSFALLMLCGVAFGAVIAPPAVPQANANANNAANGVGKADVATGIGGISLSGVNGFTTTTDFANVLSNGAIAGNQARSQGESFGIASGPASEVAAQFIVGSTGGTNANVPRSLATSIGNGSAGGLSKVISNPIGTIVTAAAEAKSSSSSSAFSGGASLSESSTATNGNALAAGNNGDAVSLASGIADISGVSAATS